MGKHCKFNLSLENQVFDSEWEQVTELFAWLAMEEIHSTVFESYLLQAANVIEMFCFDLGLFCF